MMVMWSKHTGADDPDGISVTDYMEAETVWKPKPEGGRERIRRVPPPEVLKGDAVLMRQAIRAVPFQCRYSSAVLSFERDDIDVAAFNAGEPEARRRVAEVIREFENTAYAGIPEEHRPPTFWTTHTHTGRLELNFCAPRAILNGSGQLRSINPHPPGRESIRLFDAFRDVFNARYGWADPEDPRRARLVKVPNWIQKIAAEAKRAGKDTKKQIAEMVAEYAEAALADGKIQSRDDLIAQLRAAGIDVARVGKDYVTLVNEAGVRMRLRGRLFSSDFTCPQALQPVAEPGSRLFLPECEELLTEHLERRARFHQLRYGGPEWAPPEITTGPDEAPPLARLIEPDAPAEVIARARQLGHIATARPTPSRPGDRPAPRRHHGDGEIKPDTKRQRYRVRLWVLIFGGVLPEELFTAIRWIDRDTRTVRLADGAVVIDHGDRISGTRTTDLAVKLMIAEALAKGWTSISINGSVEFKRLALAEAVRAGLTIANPELHPLVQREQTAMTKENSHDQRPHADGTRTAADGQPTAKGSGRARAAAERADRRLDDALERTRQANGALGRRARSGVTRIHEVGEVELFKRDIDLCAVAATLGFAEDVRAGDRNHRVMRHDDGTKLVIGVSKANHWVFSSNAGQAGTVVDLLCWREALGLGQIRQRLRPWIGEATRPHVDVKLYTPRSKPAPMPADTMKALAEWETATPGVRSNFLEKSRGIAPETLASQRFADTFRVDERKNAVFPYRDGAGTIVGTERRNRPSPGSDRSFKIYTAGAMPGIWTSNGAPADTRLVIVESPIDAMSHWQMLCAEEQAITRYAAIRSGFRDEDLMAIIRTMPVGAEVVSACDRDAAGDAYSTKIAAAAQRAGRPCRDGRPENGDWNDVLRQRQNPQRWRPR